MSDLLVEVTRGSLVESKHFGDLVIVGRDGRVMWSVGDPYRVTYARSSAKPLQALPLLESGAAEALHMTDEEVALACASHSGEPAHVERIAAFLQRIGVDVSKLQCGVHPPYNGDAHAVLMRSGQELTSIHNNCSGKHAGMLALAKFMGADLDTYLEPTHPVQQAIFQVVQDVCGLSAEQIHVGTDGCGVPVFGVPIDRLAHTFSQFADPRGLPEPRARAMRRIRDAMIGYAHLVAGTGRFCTGLMEAAEGAILGKAGAEGVYCLGVLPEGYGLCVKIDDGNARAAYPAVVEALTQSGIVNSTITTKLSEFHQPQLRNHKGTLVGRVMPKFQLHRHA
jgi:L-asparaginase II